MPACSACIQSNRWTRPAVACAAEQTDAIVTLEEHNCRGGLGSAVADVLAQSGFGVPFGKIAVPDRFFSKAGSQAHFQAMMGDPVEMVTRLLSRQNVAASQKGRAA